jgi:photoactive yellow protein
MFEYAFDYKMAPAKVRVHMKSASMEEGIWIFIKRL